LVGLAMWLGHMDWAEEVLKPGCSV